MNEQQLREMIEKEREDLKVAVEELLDLAKLSGNRAHELSEHNKAGVAVKYDAITAIYHHAVESMRSSVYIGDCIRLASLVVSNSVSMDARSLIEIASNISKARQ